MLQKVRMHFILVAMAALVAVLALLEVFFWYTAKTSISGRYDTIIDYIYNNDGKLPGFSDLKDSGSDSQSELGNLMSDIFGFGDQLLSPELKYQTRFFLVNLSEDGSIVSYDLSNIAGVSSDDVDDFINDTYGSGSVSGFYDSDSSSYTYKTYRNSDGTHTFIAVDTSSASWLIREISMYILLWGFIIILIFTFLVIILSKQAIAPMAANFEKQKQFVTNASHELKTPVAIISANTELMEAINGSNEWTESNMRQVKRLTALINGLVNMARVEERQSMAFDRVDLTKLAQDVLPGFKAIAENSNKSYSTSIDEGVFVSGEERALREILSIIADNAVKYCDDNGTVNIQVSPRLTRNVGTGKITGTKTTFSNTFSGGSKADLPKFFDRFYRSEESHNNKENQGFGIGLSMARELTERLGGKITVQLKDGIIIFTVIF